jgi:hypothetical protein
LRLTAVEEQGLKALLRGGVQSVRVVLRALALLRLSAGQPHSVRGFLSGTVGKKMGLKVVSAKAESGERSYSIPA